MSPSIKCIDNCTVYLFCYILLHLIDNVCTRFSITNTRKNNKRLLSYVDCKLKMGVIQIEHLKWCHYFGKQTQRMTLPKNSLNICQSNIKLLLNQLYPKSHDLSNRNS